MCVESDICVIPISVSFIPSLAQIPQCRRRSHALRINEIDSLAIASLFSLDARAEARTENIQKITPAFPSFSCACEVESSLN